MKKTIALLLTVSFALLLYAENEINISAFLQAQKGYTRLQEAPGGLVVNWNGQKSFAKTITISNGTAIALDKGTIGDVGYAYMRYLGTNDYALISLRGDATYDLKLKAGEYALLRLEPSVVVSDIKVKTGATTNLFYYLLLED